MAQGYLVPLNGIEYYLKLNEDNNNYCLTILNKNNKIYVNRQELPHNFKNYLINLRIRFKLIKSHIMLNPVMFFLFDHKNYKRIKRLSRINQ